MLVDFDELNALATTFDDYPTPEDILRKTELGTDDVPLFHSAAKPFRMLKRTLEIAANGYTYSIPDHPIELPVKKENVPKPLQVEVAVVDKDQVHTQ